jgi:hypothetical protein
MIVLDEHLQGVDLEDVIAHWYRGSVCFVGSLRPGTIIKDESIPHLLRSVRQPTKVIRVGGDHVAYYQVNDARTYILPLP